MSMKGFLTGVVFFLVTCIPFNAQNLIGYHEKDIRGYMKQNQKNMVLQGMTFNNTYRYLKYADRSQTQTLFFFLSADSVCRSVRLICDKTLKDKKVSELNSLYKPLGNNLWEEEKNGVKYSVELKDEDWTFNISITTKQAN
ncbi:MAG TPA: hypothetical protein PL040_00230 [Bacteroidales bacterium]|nr:hypothetical protein [Bacteroidales bacterium]